MRILGIDLSGAARAPLGRACARVGAAAAGVVIAAGLLQAPAVARITPATYTYGYETGFQGWVPKTDQNTGTPECSPHDSAVALSGAKARDGVRSVDLQAHGENDCGLLWLDRTFNVGTTAPVRLDLSLWVWTADSSVGPGGVNDVVARAGAACETDPYQEVDREQTWIGWPEIGSLGHGDGIPGWYEYRYQATVTPDSSGRVCVSQGMQIVSTFAFIKHYYLDTTTVTFS
ncbi:hypothetical protein [Actinomadura sp. 3N508]|uniref:hypothetical protein n=1 Tax=Actinomadura sp. 3N508 TaxID=3375153 RepID=UPI00379AB4DF